MASCMRTAVEVARATRMKKTMMLLMERLRRARPHWQRRYDTLAPDGGRRCSAAACATVPTEKKRRCSSRSWGGSRSCRCCDRMSEPGCSPGCSSGPACGRLPSSLIYSDPPAGSALFEASTSGKKSQKRSLPRSLTKHAVDRRLDRLSRRSGKSYRRSHCFDYEAVASSWAWMAPPVLLWLGTGNCCSC